MYVLKIIYSCFRIKIFFSLTYMTLKLYTCRLIPLPCIFLWVRWGVPSLNFIFPKFYYRRVPATVFHSTLTLYFLSERKKRKKILVLERNFFTYILALSLVDMKTYQDQNPNLNCEFSCCWKKHYRPWNNNQLCIRFIYKQTNTLKKVPPR